MLTQASPDPRAWTAASIDDRNVWYYRLPELREHSRITQKWNGAGI